MKKCLSALALLAVLACAAAAQDYFVDASSGDDSADGKSVATAWATIEKANEMLRPGDTVFIRSGVYNGEWIRPARSGEADARITYAAFEGHVPEVTGGRYGSVCSLNDRSYITVKGFRFHSPEEHDWLVSLSGEDCHHNRIENCDAADPEAYAPIKINGGAAYNEIIGCTVHDTGGGDEQSGDGIVVDMGAHDNMIADNRVYNCCHSQILLLRGATANTVTRNDLYSTRRDWAGAGINAVSEADLNTISHNRIHDLGYITDQKCGIQVTTRSNRIYHNVIWNVGAFGISLQSYAFQGEGQVASENLVANNTVYNTGRQGIYIVSKQEYFTRENHFINNVIAGSPADWYQVDAWMLVFDTWHLTDEARPRHWLEESSPDIWFGNTFRRNCFFHREAGEDDMVLFNQKDTSATWSIDELEEAFADNWKDNIEVKPEFTAPEKGDFSLAPESPLIDAGIDVGLPYKGASPDVGAAETARSAGEASDE